LLLFQHKAIQAFIDHLQIVELLIIEYPA